MRRPVFFGWWVVVACFVLLMTSSGLGFYGLALYLSTLNHEKGFSVTAMSGATALFFVAAGIGGVLVARLLRITSPRPLLVGGAVACAASLATLGRVVAVWQVYAVYVLFGFGYAFCGLVLTNTVVTRWFHRKRSVALSYASTGLSVGGIVLTPIVKRLIDAHGLRAVSPWIAVLFLVGAIPIPVLLLVADPASRGLTPDGDAAVETAPGQTSGWSYEDAARSAAFAAITVGFLLALMAQVGAISQLVKVAEERADAATGGAAVSALALCSVCGRLIGGRIVTRYSTRGFALGVLAVQSAGMALVANADGSVQILLAAAVFGLAVGNVLLLHPLLLAEAFGVRDYARIYSRSQLYVNLGIAAGPLLLGVLRDDAGGYTTAYLTGSALTLCGLAVYARWGGERAEAPEPGVDGAPQGRTVDFRPSQ